MSETKILTFLKILAVIGILLAVYLLQQQIFKPAFRPCTISATVNCDAVIDGPVANTLGIPTPLYGLVGYTLILWGAFKKNKKLVLGMAAFGLLFCGYIAYRELFELKVICPICIGCQIDMILTFVLAVLLYRRSDTPAA